MDLLEPGVGQDDLSHSVRCIVVTSLNVVRCKVQKKSLMVCEFKRFCGLYSLQKTELSVAFCPAASLFRLF